MRISHRGGKKHKKKNGLEDKKKTPDFSLEKTVIKPIHDGIYYWESSEKEHTIKSCPIIYHFFGCYLLGVLLVTRKLTHRTEPIRTEPKNDQTESAKIEPKPN